MKNNKIRVNRPLYSQVLDALMGMIEDGTFKIGDRLPSEDELAEQFGVSRPTLRRALGHLETQGAILRRQGIGTFVSWPSKGSFLGQLERLEPIRKMAQKAGLESQMVEQEISSIEAPPGIAEQMNVPAGQIITCNKIVEAVDGKPTFYFINYSRPEMFSPDVIRKSSKPQFELMLESTQYTYTLAELFAVAADDDVAANLQIDPGAPVFHMIETHLTSKSEIIGVSYVYSVTDTFRFYVIRRPMNV